MKSIMWHRVDAAGLDRASIGLDANGYRIAGTALLVHNDEPYDIRYSVITDPRWQTRVVAAHVQGPQGERRLSLRVDAEGKWTMGNDELDDLAGAVDVDFAFTPATNTLPIKRLALEVGESATIDVAHVAFPERSIELAAQTYERRGQDLYRFSAGSFTAELAVNDDGFVTDYPGLWAAP